MGLPYSSDGKESACNAEDPGSITGSGRSPENEMATHPSILAWRIPQTEEPGGLKCSPWGHEESLRTEHRAQEGSRSQDGWVTCR